MKELLVTAIMGLLIFTACSKDNDKPDNENPPDGTVAKGNIINFNMTNKYQPDPIMIGFSGIDSKGKPVGASLQESSTGTIQVKFFGKNGRSILQASNQMWIGIDVARWTMNIGDTVRTYQNGNLTGEYITAAGDGVNDGITFSITEGEAQNHIVSRVNGYVSDRMPLQKFKSF